MKKSFYRLSLLSFAALSCLSLSGLALAKNINLYDQPQTASKVVGTIDTSSGIISIYSPEKSEWMKVGDPKNGNVGWVKKTDLGDTKINFNIITNGKGGQNYQVFQFGNGSAYSTEDAAKTMKEIEARQQVIQQEMQKAMQQIYQNAFQMWQNMPMVVPVVVVPEKTTTQKTTTSAKPAKSN